MKIGGGGEKWREKKQGHAREKEKKKVVSTFRMGKSVLKTISNRNDVLVLQ